MSADRSLARRPRRAARIAATCTTAALALLLSAAGAQAKSPRTVEPGLMKPTLNPAFAPWTCFETGAGVTCQGSYEDSFANEAFGLQCGGRDVYLSSTFRERLTRWHTPDGRATKTIVHSDFPADVFSLSPTGDGAVFTISGHFNRHYSYAVPGELSSRTLTEIGAIYLGRSAGGPLTVHDTGRVVFAPGQYFEVVASQSGAHEFYDDPSIIDRAICEALT